MHSYNSQLSLIPEKLNSLAKHYYPEKDQFVLFLSVGDFYIYWKDWVYET